jgi:Carboxypeptidase regulatory-like domain
MTFPVRFLLPGLLLLSVGLVSAQRLADVQGIVLDGRDGQAVPQAEVRLDDKVAETRSDAFGRFQFTGIPAGSHVIEVLRPGYRKTRTEFSVVRGDSKQFQISLVPIPLKQRVVEHE